MMHPGGTPQLLEKKKLWKCIIFTLKGADGQNSKPINLDLINYSELLYQFLISILNVWVKTLQGGLIAQILSLNRRRSILKSSTLYRFSAGQNMTGPFSFL